MTTTKIHVMRHGEVDNPDGLLYGRLPGFGLTELGHQMAQRGADYLKETDADITAVIASPLLRAQQTATPTARAYELPIHSDPRLIEAGNIFEGQPVNADRRVLIKPNVLKYYRNPCEPSWGEPYAQIASRMSAALSGALKRAYGHEALVVSHQSPITLLTRFARKQMLAHAPWSRHCSLASITTFIFDDGTLVDIDYVEPSADLLVHAHDMTPGDSEAALKR